MKKQFKILSLAAGITLTLTGTAALAEQTIGVQTVAATPAIATAKVNVRVIVPKIVILRVGDLGATSTVDFTVGFSPAVGGTPGNSLTYGGGIPPTTLASTVATTNPTSIAGVLIVGAWTNASGTLLTCALSALAGTPSGFATGATALGAPGTNDITVTSGVVGTDLQHPGTSLTGCNGTTNTAIPRLTPLGGTFTYALAATNLASMATGTYGNVVTYTATAP